MASYKIAVVNEADRPMKGVPVEAIRLATLTISSTVNTDDAGQAIFTGLAGPHWFRPLSRRVTTKVGGRTYTGKVKVQVVAMGESMNVDYVVDSNGMGSHDTLFGSSGALQAALDAGGKQTIWLCATHTEPNLTAAFALGAQVVTKIITIWGPPEQRQQLTANAANPGMFSYTKDTDVHLIFINISFDVDGGAAIDIFSEVEGGTGIARLKFTFDNCQFNAIASVQHSTLNAGLSSGDKLLNHCVGTIESFIVSSAQSGTGGNIFIIDCDISWEKELSNLGNYAGSWSHSYFVRGGVHTVTATNGWFLWGNTLAASFHDLIIKYTAVGGTLFKQSSSKQIGEWAIFQNLFIISSRVDNRIIHFDSWASASPNEDAIVIDGVFIRASTSAGTPVNAIEIAEADSPDVYLGMIGCAGDWSACYVGPKSAGSGSSDHGLLSGVGDDDHTQYVLLVGRSGGQVVIGGIDAGEDFTIQSTSHATRGSIFLGSSSKFELNETTGQLLLPTVGNGAGIVIGGDTQWYRASANVIATPDTLRIGADLNHDGSNVGFYGTSPIAQAILATGAGRTVDEVITALQNLGLVKQT